MGQLTINSSNPFPPNAVNAGSGVSEVMPEAPAGSNYGAPAARTQARPNLADSQSRVRNLLNSAVKEAGGRLLLDRFNVNALAPRPLLTGKGKAAWKAVARATEEVRKGFEELDKVEIQAFRNVPLEGKAKEAYESLIDRLGDLDKHLEAFEEVTGGSPETEALRDTCMMRMSELSRFVATMRIVDIPEAERARLGLDHVRIPEMDDKSITTAIGELAMDMHGNAPEMKKVSELTANLLECMDAMTKEAATPADTKNEGFNTRLSVLDSRAMKQLAMPVLDKANGIVDFVDMLLAQQNHGGKKSAPLDASMFRAIQAYARETANRMHEALRVSPAKALKPQFIQTFTSIKNETVKKCLGLDTPLPMSTLKSLLLVQDSVNAIRQPLYEKMLACDWNDAGAVKDFCAKSEQAMERLVRESGDEHFVKARILLAVMKECLWPAPSKDGDPSLVSVDMDRVIGLADLDGRNAGALADEGFVRDLYKAGMELVNQIDSARGGSGIDAYKQIYAEAVRASVADPGMLRQELAELNRDASMNRRAVQMQRYFPLLLDHTINLSTLVEAAVRNIAPDCLETKVSGCSLIEEKPFVNNGMTNSTVRCRYQGRDGERFDMVFKNEAAARSGMAELTAAQLGYDMKTVRMAELNVASCAVADFLGCPSVLAGSRLGTHRGAFGLYMEWARGEQALVYGSEEKLKTLEPGGARGKGFEKALGELQRKLSNLEWTDLLCGQVDRHAANYMVDLDIDKGTAEVVGIDNDASFGELMVGPGIVDWTKFRNAGALIKSALVREPDANGVIPKKGAAHVEFQKDGIRLDEEELFYEEGRIIHRPGRDSPAAGTVLEDVRVLLRVDQIPDTLMQSVSFTAGLNQMSRPAYIDRSTYEKLTNIDRDKYKETLSRFMPDTAVHAAMSRLDGAVKYAVELERNGKCVEADEWRNTEMLDAARKRIQDSLDKKIPPADNKKLNFFERDFNRLLGLIAQ